MSVVADNYDSWPPAITTRPDAPLSIEQLTAIVSQPWWGFDLPAEYCGDDLPSYTTIPTDLPDPAQE